MSRATDGTPKVLSVDAVLKATLAFLQLALIALMSWVLITIVDHDGRITRNETIIDEHRGQANTVIDQLRQINEKQTTILTQQAEMRSDVNHLKTDIKTIADKAR